MHCPALCTTEAGGGVAGENAVDVAFAHSGIEIYRAPEMCDRVALAALIPARHGKVKPGLSGARVMRERELERVLGLLIAP